MRFLASTRERPDVEEAWCQVKSVRKSIWEEEMLRLQRKVTHLIARTKDCNKHRGCRDLESLAVERRRSIKESHKRVVKSALSGGDLAPQDEDPACVTSPTPRGPNDRLSRKYHLRPEDLTRITKEQEELIKMSTGYNMTLDKDMKSIGVEEESEVVTYGSVELSENERDLLNLGPNFMVTLKLDDQEMCVESSVTMTKIRWARKKMGVGDLTE